MGQAELVFEVRRLPKEKHWVKHTGEEIGRTLLDDCVRPVNHPSASVASSREAVENCEIRHPQHNEFNDKQGARFLTA